MAGELAAAGMALGGVLASKDLLNKLLGPTAEYLGGGLKNHVQRSVENVGRVFDIAYGKVGDAVDEAGSIAPRVLKSVLDEAWLTEDALAAEYFGGMLAAARGPNGNDDLLPYVNLVKQIPARQLKLHFLIYSCVARLAAEKSGASGERFPWQSWQLFVPESEVIGCLIDKDDAGGPRFVNALWGLIDQGLIGPRFCLRSSRSNRRIGQLRYSSEGLVAQPTRRGAELFLKALGLSNLGPSRLSDVDVQAHTSKALWDGLRLLDSATFVLIEGVDPLQGVYREIAGLNEDIAKIEQNAIQ